MAWMAGGLHFWQLQLSVWLEVLHSLSLLEVNACLVQSHDVQQTERRIEKCMFSNVPQFREPKLKACKEHCSN